MSQIPWTKYVVHQGLTFRTLETENAIHIFTSFSPDIAMVEVYKPWGVGTPRAAVVNWSTCGNQAPGDAGEFAAAVSLGADLAAMMNVKGDS